jgi:hypothetical protein
MGRIGLSRYPQQDRRFLQCQPRERVADRTVPGHRRHHGPSRPVLFMSVLPLFGLAPGDKNTLWVLQAGMGLFGLVGLGVAYVLVPSF